MNAPDTTDRAVATTAAVPRAIEVGFPIVEINRLAEPERNSFKPIYQMHKWFARRASCVFRARSEDMHKMLAARANELERMGGFVQVIFEWQLSFGDELWFTRGANERVPLRPLFGNVRQHHEGSNVYYLAGFNLT